MDAAAELEGAIVALQNVLISRYVSGEQPFAPLLG
jgi:hypothetical protein